MVYNMYPCITFQECTCMYILVTIYIVCEHFHRIQISPSPATFVLQKKLVENFFINAVKVLQS